MISAILLAAGESKRMKGENKLTKIIKGKPLIKHTIKNILDSNVDELIIIIGHESKKIKNIIDNNEKIKFIFNKDYKSGMASSIKIGLSNLSNKTECFLICLSDMPMISKEIYNELIKNSKKNKIVVPTYKNQQGNPVLFSILMKNKNMGIKGDLGAKEILEKNKEFVFCFETNNQSILKNYNTADSFNN